MATHFNPQTRKAYFSTRRKRMMTGTPLWSGRDRSVRT
jgi:hypothetical protein